MAVKYNEGPFSDIYFDYSPQDILGPEQWFKKYITFFIRKNKDRVHAQWKYKILKSA